MSYKCQRCFIFRKEDSMDCSSQLFISRFSGQTPSFSCFAGKEVHEHDYCPQLRSPHVLEVHDLVCVTHTHTTRKDLGHDHDSSTPSSSQHPKASFSESDHRGFAAQPTSLRRVPKRRPRSSGQRSHFKGSQVSIVTTVVVRMLLVVRPGAPSSILARSSDARNP